MEVQLEPLLKYAEELLQSYSRIIVYSGDILQSLPEPREGLSTANIKPKKEETIAFQREWKHLESVFDEFLIRLNDIRTRAHEELEAARVKCLVGEDIDLALPEAVFKLKIRLTQYKRQYAGLLKVIGGGSVEDIEDPVQPPMQTDVDMGNNEKNIESAPNSGNELLRTKGTDSSPSAVQKPSMADPASDGSATGTSDAKVTTSQEAETPGIMVVDGDDYDDVVDIESQEPASTKDKSPTGMDVNTPMSVQSEHKTTGTPAANVTGSEVMDISDSPAPTTDTGHAAAPVSIDADADSLFDVQSNTGNEAIGVDSNSDMDNEDMEDIFQ
ncbi:hypothetical protein IW140_001655 [Coemansia sp. RSA 1813]|nr:hypothetical protein EV178_005880 [Coemansia sp. RSA 1646]KAJ1769815.1 hypothetical protein LPJ74_003730 [Coemansia sp. RSA 1843]KAJ2091253.1 hypothetical protein IW138_001952 [Coemansia sp. RSA 986]KAJ2216441.1 hypothetical protein EV179_001236 [Coemansia sp. RSA 487]KAJ2571475.1 hypothetical protein IW140_001655 [Coemansia sp. RSA 1813]